MLALDEESALDLSPVRVVNDLSVNDFLSSLLERFTRIDFIMDLFDPDVTDILTSQDFEITCLKLFRDQTPNQLKRLFYKLDPASNDENDVM